MIKSGNANPYQRNFMKILSIVFVLLFSILGFATDYEISEEMILKAVINAKSSTGNLKQSTIEKRYQETLLETQSFLDRFEFAGLRAYLPYDESAKIYDTKRVAHFIKEVRSTVEYGLEVKSTGLTYYRNGTVVFPERYYRGQMVVRNIGNNQVVISGYNGKSTIEFLIDYTPIFEIGPKAEPKVKLTHMSDFQLKETRLKSISNLPLTPMSIGLGMKSSEMQWNYRDGMVIPENGKIISDQKEVNKTLKRQLNPKIRCSSLASL